MKKRRIALLAGLMAIGMVSFAATEDEGNVEKLTPVVGLEGNSDVLKTEEQKELTVFNINDRVRFDENRLELNGNMHFNENNRLEMRVRQYNNVSNGGMSDDRKSGNTTDDSTELRLRLHTQTSMENMEVRTELKTTTYEDGSKQYFRVQPTYNLFTGVEGLSSLVRAGLAFGHNSPDSASTEETYSFSSSFENFYTVNDYLSIENNYYYDYDFAGKGTDRNNTVQIEAYVYTNYPLYNADGLKVEALLEGGFDPYSFGSRNFSDLTDANEKGSETYVFYAEPSVKATKELNNLNNVYLQAGYYTENNEKTSENQYEDTAFVRVGFTSKF